MEIVSVLMLKLKICIGKVWGTFMQNVLSNLNTDVPITIKIMCICAYVPFNNRSR